MTLQELIISINAELEKNFKKEVLKTSAYGYNYDTTTGRKVIKSFELSSMLKKMNMAEYVDFNIFDSDRKIKIYNETFKLKKKKSGMKSNYSYNELMTIVKLESIDVDEKTLKTDVLELQRKMFADRLEQKKQEEQIKEKHINDFLTKLNQFNITMQKFNQLYVAYSGLTREEKNVLNNK